MDYKKRFMGAAFSSGLLFGLAGAPMAATPLTTIPWNGHTGAASFTFDDAMDDQIQNLTPILEELPDVRVTFFLSNMGGNRVKAAGAGFAKLAKMGNEIGNHTNSHSQLPELSDAQLKAEAVDFADEIEKIMKENGAEVNVTALATPFCANNEKVSAVINQRQFINRDGGWYGPLNWDKEPEWLKMKARVWNSASAEEAEGMLNALDTAAYIKEYKAPEYSGYEYTGPSWVVFLNHGVSNDGGMSIPPTDIKNAFERALKNNMWVAPFSTVGAYLKAHFTLDAAEAVADGENFKVSWEMPHPHMPKSIPLKVKLNSEFQADAFGDMAIRADGTAPSIVLEQNGKVIWPDANGIYTIEFTELSLNIRVEKSEDSAEKPASSSSVDAAISSSSETSAIHARDLAQELVGNSSATYTIFDMNGNRLGSAEGFKVPESLPRGAYIIRGEAPGLAPITKKIIK